VSVTGAEASHVEECPDTGPACRTDTPPAPYEHHVRLVTTELALDGAYGLTSFLAVEGRLSLRILGETPRYTELDGTPKSVPDEIHHRDETLVGPGDPWLLARFGGRIGPVLTAARAGVSFPLGSTQPNPYRLGEEGKRHEHIQLGTGTFLPIVGFGVSVPAGPLVFDATALGFFSLYANGYGYRAPSRFIAGLRATVPLLAGKLRPFATFEVPLVTAERWDGLPGGENGGARTDVLAGVGLSASIGEIVDVDLSVRARLATAPADAGFAYPGIVSIGFAKRFELTGRARDAKHAPAPAPITPIPGPSGP
jgi:hypothetical protein